MHVKVLNFGKLYTGRRVNRVVGAGMATAALNLATFFAAFSVSLHADTLLVQENRTPMIKL